MLVNKEYETQSHINCTVECQKTKIPWPQIIFECTSDLWTVLYPN
jgi:hypothetical protein